MRTRRVQKEDTASPVTLGRMIPDPGNTKRALRAELRQRRRGHTATERDELTAGLTAVLQRFVEEREIESMSAYLSAADEPNIRPFLNWAAERGIRTLLPITREDGLLDWAVGDGSSEMLGREGMPEVVGEVLSPLALGDVDVVIAPAAAVDRSGVRMGWGRGYYDKTLGSMAKRPPVYAVIFDAELVDELPRERHDQPVDGIITPSRILTFRS
jgi:5-formyltetrahydrofolate cyclo-ligase